MLLLVTMSSKNGDEKQLQTTMKPNRDNDETSYPV